MNCRKVRCYLSTYSEGSLPSDQYSEMEVHIKTCKSCEREKFYLEEIKVAVRSIPARPAPDDFNLKLFNRIYAEQNNPTESYLPTPESSWIRRPVGWVSALATVAVVALVAVVFLRQPADSPEMPLGGSAYSQAETSQPHSPTAMRYARQRVPANIFENIIGVRGASSGYRATNVSQVKSLRLADAKVESLYVVAMKRLGAQPTVAMMQAADSRYYDMRSPLTRTRNNKPLMRNAASQISY